MRSLQRRTGNLCAVALLLAIAAAPARACPLCPPQQTLSERIAQSEGCFVVRMQAGSGGRLHGGHAPPALVQITSVLKNTDPPRKIAERLNLGFSFDPGQERTLLVFLLPGEENRCRWDIPLPASAHLLAYLNGRPDSRAPTPERLRYFLGYLEHPDESVAVDAFSEFGVAEYKHVKSLAAEFPREKVREWVRTASPASGRIARLAFYGMVLGLCGTADDARMLESIILQPGEDFRIGIEGLMAGYLLLAKEEGLAKLEQFALSGTEASLDALALQTAARFLWDFGDGSISRERLRATQRRLLDFPELADGAITDLARWEDLSVVDRLAKLIDDPRYNDRTVTSVIVQYYFAMSTLPTTGRPEVEQQAIARAKQHLEAMRARDPDLVRSTERRLRVSG